MAPASSLTGVSILPLAFSLDSHRERFRPFPVFLLDDGNSAVSARQIDPRGITDMDFGFTQEQQRLIERVKQLVKERIGPRAARYDLGFDAPAEDLDDIFREG